MIKFAHYFCNFEAVIKWKFGSHMNLMFGTPKVKSGSLLPYENRNISKSQTNRLLHLIKVVWFFGSLGMNTLKQTVSKQDRICSWPIWIKNDGISRRIAATVCQYCSSSMQNLGCKSLNCLTAPQQISQIDCLRSLITNEVRWYLFRYENEFPGVVV